MQCNCRKDLEERLAEQVKKGLPEGFKDYRADIQGYALILSDPVEERLSVKYQGEVFVPKKDPSNGHKRQKIDVNVTVNYCPFCGKSASKDKEQ